MSKSQATNASFKTHLRHRKLRTLFRDPKVRAPGYRSHPATVVFEPTAPVAEGDDGAPLPPVRIFVGTEPAQYRAERIFLYSIERHRDPSRRYEVALMSELDGFDRSTWKTGFTQYRYAVPSLAGFEGRAIYNDVDQIYLADPAELFDADMEGNAVLSIDEKETSVMLLDCEKLAALWPDEQARTPGKHKVFRACVREAGLWGEMDRGWNTRDDEHQLGRTKLLHFTTLHTQPWRPFPDQLRYRPHPFARTWQELEEAADAAGFTGFSRRQPSPAFAGRCAEAEASPAGAVSQAFDRALTESDPARRLWARARVQRDEIAADCEQIALSELLERDMPTPVDHLAVSDLAACIPPEDALWVLDALFARARRELLVEIQPTRAAYPASWWQQQCELVSRMHPEIKLRLFGAR